MSLIPVAVRATDPSDLSAFGIRVTIEPGTPRYLVEDGAVWKAACWVVLYDNGRMLVQTHNHMTLRELRVVYGLAEQAFTGGQAKCRYEKWERCRQNKSRAVAFYRRHFYVLADTRETTTQLVLAAAGLDEYDLEKAEALGIDREVAA